MLTDEQRKVLEYAVSRLGEFGTADCECADDLERLFLNGSAAPAEVCDTCGSKGKICVGTSGCESDGYAPEIERCPTCGYGDAPAEGRDSSPKEMLERMYREFKLMGPVEQRAFIERTNAEGREAVDELPDAWINHPVKTVNGEFAGYEKPELAFTRLGYGYDTSKAEPLFRRANAALATAPSQATTTSDAASMAMSDAIKLACETRHVEFDIDAPGATVGRLLLWERGAATTAVEQDERAADKQRSEAFGRYMGEPWEAALDAKRRIWSLAWGAARAIPATAPTMSEAVRDVLAERRRQVTEEGWTPEHDDEHADGQLAGVAGWYTLACTYPHERDLGRGHIPPYWPWDNAWWKPSTKRRNLVKAGALILAEIERIDRANAEGEKS